MAQLKYKTLFKTLPWCCCIGQSTNGHFHIRLFYYVNALR